LQHDLLQGHRNLSTKLKQRPAGTEEASNGKKSLDGSANLRLTTRN